MLLGVAACPARAQQPRPQTTAPTFDAAAVATESTGAFAGRAFDLRRLGDWSQLREVGRTRRTAHPDEALGWNAEALAAYSSGDVEAAIADWEIALKNGGDKETRELLATARAVQRNYPGQSFKLLQFVGSDVEFDQLKWKRQAAALLKAKDYDAIERVAGELQKSKRSDAMGKPFLQSFFEGLSQPAQNAQPLEQSLRDWRAARPDSDLARLVEIEFSTNMAWRARGDGFGDSITPAISERMNEALARGAQIIGELPKSASESPLMFVVLQRWGQIAGDGRPFLDAIYREGSARFPDYLPLLRGRIVNLLPRWYGAEGELPQLLREHADQIGGIEGDMDYALGFMVVHNFEGESAHDNARFWRGFDALRKRSPDSSALRTAQLHFGDDQGRLDGNYEHAKSVLSEPRGHVLDQIWFGTPQLRADMSERRMEILAKE